MSAVAHLPVISIYELLNSAITDVCEHYNNVHKITFELKMLVQNVTKSGDCKLGSELLMCLDEFNGAEFKGDLWWVIYVLRSAKGGTVLWYGT